MKKFITISTALALTLSMVACAKDEPQPEVPAEVENNGTTDGTEEDSVDLSGVYTGYSWRGESKGTTLEEANQKVETILELDKDGNIVAADMNFLKLDKEGNWYERNDTSGSVTVDFGVEPTIATPGEEYAKGDSMFAFDVTDMMSIYATAVDTDGTVAYGFVDPINRYLYEAKFAPDFDFAGTTVADLTINNGFVPTTRTSTGGMIKPTAWDEYLDTNMLGMNDYSYVVNMRGDYRGITTETTVEELLTLSGVKFVDGMAQPKEATYDFHSNGGWNGNYEAFAESVTGKNAMELTSLINYTGSRYADSVNEENFFGINTDTVASATKTAQDSYDTIAGATVRFSRENTSYQRALVEAGIISEEDVIKGRF